MFEWKPGYSLGHGDIDGQHKKLFELASELHAAMMEGKGENALSATLARLITYTKTHFANEERLMQTYHYPDYPDTKRRAMRKPRVSSSFRKSSKPGASE